LAVQQALLQAPLQEAQQVEHSMEEPAAAVPPEQEEAGLRSSEAWSRIVRQPCEDATPFARELHQAHAAEPLG